MTAASARGIFAPLRESTTSKRSPSGFLWGLAMLAAAGSTAAHEIPGPSIVHNARDGVVRLYGAGGPEPAWSKKAPADADILWGTAEEDITALLETCKSFSWNDVTPIYIRPAVIAVKKRNPKHIRGFDDLLKDGMRIVATDGAGVANTRQFLEFLTSDRGAVIVKTEWRVR